LELPPTSQTKHPSRIRTPFETSKKKKLKKKVFVADSLIFADSQILCSVKMANNGLADVTLRELIHAHAYTLTNHEEATDAVEGSLTSVC
tara:strand:- start:499 stop:768 length:270 start_codon:yes stop_codon:yes gene_type:complete